MSMSEILAELPKLSPTQRAEVRSALATLDDEPWDDDGDLPSEDKALLLARVEECDRHPEKLIPWEQVEARLKSRFGGRSSAWKFCRRRRLTLLPLRSGMPSRSLDWRCALSAKSRRRSVRWSTTPCSTKSGTDQPRFGG